MEKGPWRNKQKIFKAEKIPTLLVSQERVAAALENSHLLQVVNQCLVEREETDL